MDGNASIKSHFEQNVDFLVINFILTMLMILKRVHILIRKEIQ